MTGGNALLQACDAIAVKPRERNGEAVPELLLKLFKHGLDGEDENALAALALDELGNEHACFERLADADRVGDQNAGTRGFKGPDGRLKLIGEHVHGGVLSNVDLGVGGGRPAKEGVNEETRADVVHGVVLHEARLLRIEDLDLLLEFWALLVFDDELGGAAAHEIGNADAGQHREDAAAFVMNGTDMLDQPFGVADDDAHARSKASLFCHFDEFLRVLETAAPDGTARLQQGKLKPSSTSKVSWPGSSAIACVPGGRQFPISYQVRRKRERNRELSSEAVLGFEVSNSVCMASMENSHYFFMKTRHGNLCLRQGP